MGRQDYRKLVNVIQYMIQLDKQPGVSNSPEYVIKLILI